MLPAPQPQSPPVRTRTVWLLSAVVVLVHVLVLQGMAVNLRAPDRLSTRAFTTRSIQIQPPPATAAPLPRRPVSLTPKPRPRPQSKRPVRPKTEGVLAASAPTAQAMPEPAPEPPAPEPPTPTPTAPELPEPTVDMASQAPEPALDVAVAEPTPPASASIASAPAAVASARQAEAPIAQAAPTQPAPDLVAAAATRPLTIPGSIRLAFDAVGKRGRLDYKAMGDLVWLQDGASYDMRMEMGDWIIGKRVLSSTGTLTASGLAPTRFSDKFRSERAAHFDRQLGRITFSANTAQVPLMPGAQDQLSVFAQLAAMVAGDPLAYPIGATATIQTAGPRDAEPWVFVVEREEMLYLPGGQVPALKLVRTPNKDYGQKVELWLAPQLAFLPARIKITFANGDYLDQQWKSSSAP